MPRIDRFQTITKEAPAVTRQQLLSANILLNLPTAMSS
jgi:hypothetical protein